MSVTPGGAQTRSKSPGVWGKERYAGYALGCQVGLSDGTLYTDWIAGLAAVGLGYALLPADRAQMAPLPTKGEAEAAQMLLEVLPGETGWDQVRWVTTGSEATVGAMMIARRATGRRKIISVGYHGWHEAHLPSRDLVTLPIDSWRDVDGTVAAVLVEPMRNEKEVRYFTDRESYLKDIWRACQEVGALFIVDEIVTGFRYALGGATERYGLTPDLACYGKAMSNGFPIAAIVGHHSLMKHAVDVSGTYNGWPPALYAVRETIKTYVEKDVVGHMWSLGQRLIDQSGGVLTGWPCHPVFACTKDYTTSERALPWVEKAEARGHLVHPSGLNIMLAHTEQDVDRLSEALTS